MDLTYENNKGLYAFVMAFMIMLAVLLPTTSSYAAGAYYYSVDDMRTELKASFSQQGKNYTDSYYKETVYYLNYENGSKGVVIFNTHETPKLDLSYDSLRFVDASGSNSLSGGAVFKRVNASGELIRDVVLFPDNRSAMNFSDLNVSFTLRVPPKPFPGELAVKEMPGILGGQAGTITLVGCLILGTLLAVGSVKRLISLFTR